MHIFMVAYRMGVLVGFPNKEAEDAGKDVAMQNGTAVNPYRYRSKFELPADHYEKKRYCT